MERGCEGVERGAFGQIRERMTSIDSPIVQLGADAATLIEQVADPARLEALLPADKISNFAATEDGCSFKVPGGIPIVLGRDEVVPGERVRYGSRKGTPIRFVLDLVFTPVEAGRCDAQVRCQAELNPFTKMMAEKALTSLFDAIASNLRATYP